MTEKTEKRTFFEHMEAMGISKADAKLLAGKCVTNNHIAGVLGLVYLKERITTGEIPSRPSQNTDEKARNVAESMNNARIMTEAVAGYDPTDPKNHNPAFLNAPAKIRTHQGAEPSIMTFKELYDTILRDVPTVTNGEVDLSDPRHHAKSGDDLGALMMLKSDLEAVKQSRPCEIPVAEALGAAPTQICAANNAGKEQFRG